MNEETRTDAARRPFRAVCARILPVLLFCAAGPGLFALGETTLVIGGEAGWSLAETRRAVTEVSGYRPGNVMVLDSARAAAGTDLDLAINFDRAGNFADETGHYAVMAAPGVRHAEARYARSGMGAALFSGGSSPLDAASGADPLVITPRESTALFSGPLPAGALPANPPLAGERRLQNFSIEFWINPVNLETGGQILYWSAVRTAGNGGAPAPGRQAAPPRSEAQWIVCETARNRLQWTFHNFFAAPFDGRSLNAALSGISTVTPGIWSRHEIRFDADTGALEYLVNGVTESIAYMTSTGREGGEVFTPVAGRGSRIVLGGRYAGFLDEFRIYGAPAEPAAGQDGPAYRNIPAAYRGGEKYPLTGGRFETSFIDLGQPDSRIILLEAAGGLLRNRRAASGGGRAEVIPEYLAGNTGERFSFPDASAMRFFVRAANTPFPGAESPWRAVSPGRELDIRGRYAWIAAEFYPSGDGENTPWLEEIRLVWLANDPPRPPLYVAAAARDGAVELVWNAGADRDVTGYLVYFGVRPGEYFGVEGAASPLDAGGRTSLRIGGLRNGVLYYFAVSAYDASGPLHGGEFSREVSARPLRMTE